MDMETLQHQFYGVMHKYQIAFSKRGVTANLNKWWGNKRGLYDLLRRHSNWDEQELAMLEIIPAMVPDLRPDNQRNRLDWRFVPLTVPPQCVQQVYPADCSQPHSRHP